MLRMSSKSKEGRPPNVVTYKHITYNTKDYTIGEVIYKDELIKFIIDKEDYDKVSVRSWHISSNNYIGSSYTDDDGSKKVIYLHNLIMNRADFPGKGTTESVDHINRIGLDNRKENLRIVSQTEQNLNQKRRQRTCVLPEGCDIKISDVPKHIWYIKPNGLHGDRFGIDFKTENLKWKSSSSKKLSLKDKLEEAKEKLKEYYTLYPYLDPDNPEKLLEIKTLTDSFNEIIKI